MWMMVITAATVLFDKMFLTMWENSQFIHASVTAHLPGPRVGWVGCSSAELRDTRQTASSCQHQRTVKCVFVCIWARDSKKPPERINMHPDLSEDKGEMMERQAENQMEIEVLVIIAFKWQLSSSITHWVYSAQQRNPSIIGGQNNWNTL